MTLVSSTARSVGSRFALAWPFSTTYRLHRRIDNLVDLVR
jgi:hypothetical protein